MADALALTLACTTAADPPVNYSLLYVPQRRPVNSPSPPWEPCADMPKSTLIFQFGSIFGSIRELYVPHACKLPIAPMGDSRVARCEQGGGVYVSYGTVTITSSSITGNTASGSVRAHVQNFPSPRWENVLLNA
jgi:hypothetical protein